jgi:hypothetical protein
VKKYPLTRSACAGIVRRNPFVVIAIQEVLDEAHSPGLLANSHIAVGRFGLQFYIRWRRTHGRAGSG